MSYLSLGSVRSHRFRPQFEHSVCALSHPPVLKPGDRHPAVRTLRLLLASSQYFRLHSSRTQTAPLTLGDRFTAEVEQWVKQFQSCLFLPVDGRVGPETWRALCADAPVHLSQLEWGDRGSEVQLLQRHLIEHHQFSGTVNGLFALHTEAAVRRFQQTHNLVVDGIVGAKTWQALSVAAYQHQSKNSDPAFLDPAFSDPAFTSLN